MGIKENIKNDVNGEQIPRNIETADRGLLRSLEPSLWNSKIGRRAFVKKTGAATVGTAIALHGFRMEVMASESGLQYVKVLDWWYANSSGFIDDMPYQTVHDILTPPVKIPDGASIYAAMENWITSVTGVVYGELWAWIVTGEYQETNPSPITSTHAAGMTFSPYSAPPPPPNQGQ